MDDIQTVEELNQWASQRGLMNDDLVNLRRLQLMADEISNRTENDDNVCNTCCRRFKEKKHLLRHQRTVHTQAKNYQCSVCSAHFNRADALRRHSQIHQRKRKHDQDDNASPPTKQIRQSDDTGLSVPMEVESSETSKEWNNLKENDLPATKQTEGSTLREISSNGALGKCIWCTQNKALLPNKKFCATCATQGRECKWCHRPLPERFYSMKTDVCDRCVTRRQKFSNRQQQQGGGKVNALEETARSETLQPNPGNLWDILQFFVDNQQQIEKILSDRLLHVKGMKWFMTLFVKFVKYNQNNEAVYAEPTFRSLSLACTNVSQIKEQMAEAFQHLHNSYQNFERDGSGWSIDKIMKLEVNTIEFVPLEGSSYIPLPAQIQKKKAILNIQNKDHKCLLWSVLASLHPVSRNDNPKRVSNYLQYEHELKTNAIDFPTPLSQYRILRKITTCR